MVVGAIVMRVVGGGVADSDLSKPWEGKISTADLEQGGKTIHLVRC